MKRTAPFSKAAIRNACIAAAFAAAPAGLVGLSAIADNHFKGVAAECNNGTWTACEELLDIESQHGNVTNPKFKAEVAKREAQKAAEEREANKWKPKTSYHIQHLANACSDDRLRPLLKDPRSLRVLNHGMSELTDTHVTVWVEYTATNGFGGPTRDTFSCKYNRYSTY